MFRTKVVSGFEEVEKTASTVYKKILVNELFGLDLVGVVIDRNNYPDLWLSDPASVPWVPGAKDFIEKWYHMIVFISRVPNPETFIGIQRWIDANCKEFHHFTNCVHMCLEKNDKHAMITDLNVVLFVDEHEGVCRDIRKFTQCRSIHMVR